jgi:hypothetical protein
MIATALLAVTKSGQVIAVYVLGCAVVSIAATVLLPHNAARDISQEYA